MEPIGAPYKFSLKYSCHTLFEDNLTKPNQYFYIIEKSSFYSLLYHKAGTEF